MDYMAAGPTDYQDDDNVDDRQAGGSGKKNAGKQASNKGKKKAKKGKQGEDHPVVPAGSP